MSEEELLKLVEIPPEDKMGDYAIPCFAMAKKMHRRKEWRSSIRRGKNDLYGLFLA